MPIYIQMKWTDNIQKMIKMKCTFHQIPQVKESVFLCDEFSTNNQEYTKWLFTACLCDHLLCDFVIIYCMTLWLFTAWLCDYLLRDFGEYSCPDDLSHTWWKSKRRPDVLCTPVSWDRWTVDDWPGGITRQYWTESVTASCHGNKHTWGSSTWNTHE